MESYRDHSDFLKNRPRYAFLFQIDPLDYEDWARGLKKAGYATNPKYPQILIKLIEDYHLQDYTLIAMGKMEGGEEMIAKNRAKSNNQPGQASQNEQETIQPAAEIEKINYPSGEFRINETRVVYVRKEHTITFHRSAISCAAREDL